jgi:urease accessory protein
MGSRGWPTLCARRFYLTCARSAVRASLEFGVAGGRTTLLHQQVPYPFHITRPFYLDPDAPNVATLYLQSASGGMYRGEQLNLNLNARQGSAVAVTTQSATIVHNCYGFPATQIVRLSAAADSIVMYMPECVVLFPGASLYTVLDVTLEAGAVAVCQEGFACHDPHGGSATFDQLSSELNVRDASGRVYVADRGTIIGLSLGTAASPLGPYHACGSVFLLGMPLPDAAELARKLDGLDCFSGVSSLPNGIGTAIRVLARSGSGLAAGLACASAACFQAAVGVTPAPRRK